MEYQHFGKTKNLKSIRDQVKVKKVGAEKNRSTISMVKFEVTNAIIFLQKYTAKTKITQECKEKQ